MSCFKSSSGGTSRRATVWRAHSPATPTAHASIPAVSFPFAAARSLMRARIFSNRRGTQIITVGRTSRMLSPIFSNDSAK